MANDPRDRQGDGVESSEGDSGGEGVAAPTLDIFDTVARRVVEARMELHNTDDTWTGQEIADAFAAGYRVAMQQLDVEVKPHGARPKPARTKSGRLLLLFAALENSDLYPRVCSLPVITTDGTPRLPVQTVYPIEFDCGLFRIVIEYVALQNAYGDHVWRWSQVTRVYLDTGQSYTVPDAAQLSGSGVEHPMAWLAHYRPAPELDTFSPLVQLSLIDLANRRGEPISLYPIVEREDHDARTYKWVHDELRMWRDARGRLVYEG